MAFFGLINKNENTVSRREFDAYHRTIVDKLSSIESILSGINQFNRANLRAELEQRLESRNDQTYWADEIEEERNIEEETRDQSNGPMRQLAIAGIAGAVGAAVTGAFDEILERLGVGGGERDSNLPSSQQQPQRARTPASPTSMPTGGRTPSVGGSPQRAPSSGTRPRPNTPSNALQRSTEREFNLPQDYLGSIARRESSGRLDARNPNSSATGLYQFIDSTWLQYARRLYRGSDEQLLGLRYNEEAQNRVMGEFTRDNANYLRQRNVPVNGGTLYMAHFLGPQGAARLWNASQQNPNQSAAALLPEAAAANRSIFYRNGSPITVSELVSNLTSTYSPQQQRSVVPAPPEPDSRLALISPAGQAAGLSVSNIDASRSSSSVSTAPPTRETQNITLSARNPATTQVGYEQQTM